MRRVEAAGDALCGKHAIHLNGFGDALEFLQAEILKIESLRYQE